MTRLLSFGYTTSKITNSAKVSGCDDFAYRWRGLSPDLEEGRKVG